MRNADRINYELRHCGNEASNCSLCVPAPNVSVGLCSRCLLQAEHARYRLESQKGHRKKCCSQDKIRKMCLARKCSALRDTVTDIYLAVDKKRLGFH